MTTKTKCKPAIEKELPIYDERLFQDSDEQHFSKAKEVHTLDPAVDPYIIAFTGRRGGGKTTAMTFYALMNVRHYNPRILSNYEIECQLRRFRPDGQSYLQHVKSEPLDFEKLMVGDNDYHDCLILIDEAPDIISHMASQSWRNRLVAAFTRQIRKNNITLLLASQSFDLIDKSVRWQTDIEIDCTDAARSLGDNADCERGEVIWLKFYDHSGIWTGETTEERRFKHEDQCVMRVQLYPRFMFGDDGHKPAFDSWATIDILDSLRRVDLKLSKITIGDKGVKSDAALEFPADKYPVSIKILKSMLSSIEAVMEIHPETPFIYQTEFNNSLGPVTAADKNNTGKVLTVFDVERGRDNSNGKRYYGFEAFNIIGFREYIAALEARGN